MITNPRNAGRGLLSPATDAAILAMVIVAALHLGTRRRRLWGILGWTRRQGLARAGANLDGRIDAVEAAVQSTLDHARPLVAVPKPTASRDERPSSPVTAALASR